MKYTTFRALLIAVGGVVCTGATIAACMSCSGGSTTDNSSAPGSTAPAGTTSNRAPPRPAPSPRPGGPTVATDRGGTTATDPGALRPMDTRILDKVRAGFSGDKVKDAFKGESYKVNLYVEDGKKRAKVDLDRDEKWDEKWDFETDGDKEVVKRQVSTADDDKYDLEFRLLEGKWVQKQK